MEAREKDAAHFRAVMRSGEVWIGSDTDGRVCGAYELWWSDEDAWGVQPPVAGYVHRLMVARETAPAGTGRRLLEHAERRVAGTAGNGRGWTASPPTPGCSRTTEVRATGWSGSSPTRRGRTAGSTG